jgi:hypothetical protein
MARKSTRDGRHVLRRFTPQHFAVKPLRRRRLSVYDWIWSTFLRGRDPFRASPFASEIGIRERIEKAAMQATEDSDARSVFIAIETRLKDYAEDAKVNATRLADILSEELTDTGEVLSRLDTDDLERESLRRLNDNKSNAESRVNQSARASARALLDLEDFYQATGLPRNSYAGRKSTTGTWILAGGILVGEFFLNASFFAEILEDGLVGGAAFAAMNAVVTILFGVFAGRSFQMIHPLYQKRPLGLGLMAAAILLTTFYLLLLTNVRRAASSGALNPFTEGPRMLLSSPLSGLLDMYSFVYTLFSVAVISWVAYEFYQLNGHFPDHKRHIDDEQQRRADVVDEITDCKSAWRECGESVLTDIKLFLASLGACEAALENSQSILERTEEQFKADIERLVEAESILTNFVAIRALRTSAVAKQPWNPPDLFARVMTAPKNKLASLVTAVTSKTVAATLCHEKISKRIDEMTQELQSAFENIPEHVLAEEKAIRRGTLSEVESASASFAPRI